MAQEFHLQEATIASIHAAYAAGTITARQLTQLYLDRIEAYDRNGPQINSIITVNPRCVARGRAGRRGLRKHRPYRPDAWHSRDP